MKTEINANAFTTNFSHRLAAKLDEYPGSLYDCMNSALERAAVIVDLIEVVAELKMSSEVNNLWRAAQAARYEILDAQAMLDAYVDGVHSAPKTLQSDDEGARDESAIY